MRDLKIAIVALIGMFLGAIFGLIGPFFVCFTIDSINNASPGNGLMTVGWVFCFITIPLFAFLGSVWFTKIAKKRIADD